MTHTLSILVYIPKIMHSCYLSSNTLWVAGQVRGYKFGPSLLQPFSIPPPPPPWASYLTTLPTIPGGRIQLNGWLQTGGLGAGMFLWHWRAHTPPSSGEQLNHSSLITVKAVLAQAPTITVSSRLSLVVSPMFTSKIHTLAAFISYIDL